MKTGTRTTEPNDEALDQVQEGRSPRDRSIIACPRLNGIEKLSPRRSSCNTNEICADQVWRTPVTAHSGSSIVSKNFAQGVPCGWIGQGYRIFRRSTGCLFYGRDDLWGCGCREFLDQYRGKACGQSGSVRCAAHCCCFSVLPDRDCWNLFSKNPYATRRYTGKIGGLAILIECLNNQCPIRYAMID